MRPSGFPASRFDPRKKLIPYPIFSRDASPPPLDIPVFYWSFIKFHPAALTYPSIHRGELP